MNPLDYRALEAFIQQEIQRFHENRLRALEKIKLTEVLRKKNPYLFRAKNLTTASDLISAMLDARLSSSEEELFGSFLEAVALFIAQQTAGAHKSSAIGIDLEFQESGVHYLVSVKSGFNWGNSSQYRALERNFQNAIKIQRESRPRQAIQAVLGMCYGRAKPVDTGLYLKIMGQAFWEFISGSSELYTDMIEPIGYNARQHTEQFIENRAALHNRLAKDFIEAFCFADGHINWPKVVRFNSANRE